MDTLASDLSGPDTVSQAIWVIFFRRGIIVVNTIDCTSVVYCIIRVENATFASRIIVNLVFAIGDSSKFLKIGSHGETFIVTDVLWALRSIDSYCCSFSAFAIYIHT